VVPKQFSYHRKANSPQYQAASDPRVKLTVLFNSGNLGGQKVNPALLKGTVAYFLGGPKDIAQRNVRLSYVIETRADPDRETQTTLRSGSQP
jgi:hypothetical protein